MVSSFYKDEKMRKTYCKNCKKEIDETTRSNSIQEFGITVCSIKCGLESNHLKIIEKHNKWKKARGEII